MKLDIDRLKSWTGHQEILEDLVTPVPVAALSEPVRKGVSGG
jgi:hypothetical protein